MFFGVVPGLVEEIDKTQHGTVTAEVSTGSGMRTDSGLGEGQTRKCGKGWTCLLSEGDARTG